MRRFSAGIAVMALTGSFFYDQDVIDWVKSQSHPALHGFAQLVSRILDWPPVIAFLGGTYWAVRRWGPAENRRWVGAALIGAALCGLVGTLLRSLIGRARPSAPVEPGWYGPWHHGHWIFGQHDFAAFPSGHTSTLAGAAGVLLLARPRWGAVALALTLLVAWSRIYLNAHRLSDVVAATILGLGGGAWIWLRWGRGTSTLPAP